MAPIDPTLQASAGSNASAVLSNSLGATLTSRVRVKPTLEPSKILAGKKVVVIGGTGFLGKVWVAMLLHRFPELGHVYLVVRAKRDQSPEERFWADIASSPTFDPIREAHPGASFEAFLREKITPVAGDMARPAVGFTREFIEAHAGDIAAVVNVAGVVDFNPPLDEALEANAFGVNNLIDLCRALGAPVMHTSTCYVAGYRTGLIEEVDPRDVPFPRAENAPAERLIAMPDGGVPVNRKLDRTHWDPQNEIRECLDVIEHVRHRCEDAYRQSAFLDVAKKNLVDRGEPCRGVVLEDELAKVKRKYVREQLTEAGRERALYWGWSNIYTYTKSIGEQVLMASGVPVTIVRPAVIESSCEFPFPGWNEGINTSAPFIYMALKGQSQFPADENVHLDIIPVDFVCSGMIASLVELIEGNFEPVYQYGCGDVNGCKMSRYMELIGLYKRKKLQDGGDEGNRLVNAILARVEPVNLSKREYQTHGAHAVAKVERGVASVLDALALGPAAALFKPAAKALRKVAATEDKMGDVMDLFLPFTAECEWIFSCANTRAALDRMPDEERARLVWYPERIDWRAWMYDVHIPAIEKWAGPQLEEKLRRETKPLRRHETLVALLDEMAERHDHGVALRMLEDDGLSRITFIEWREASATVAARLAARGVQPGDRVVLTGDNRPAWPIAYFGILRAGAVAVPIDPKLSSKQIANVVQASGARVALWGEDVDGAAGLGVRQSLPELEVLDLDEVIRNDARLVPPAVEVRPDALASIIYTSGTTGEPKGVMLTHENFTSLLASLTPLFFLSPSDGVLSVLPLHHTFEFSCGLLLPMSRGASITYIGEITSERLGEGLSKARVSAMVGVPALWQLLERRIVNQAKDRGKVAGAAFDWALELNRMLGKTAGMDAGKLFFGPVHDKLGGRVKYLISGGSALPKSTAETFAGLGLHLSEGYGLTEAAPVLTVAKASPRSRAGHVGKAIPGITVRIANADKDGVGEVWAKGPNVMQGYFGNEEATRGVVDAEGWLHTGDLGKLDKKGQLVLVGRSKDVIVGASGENVYPDDVEELLGKVADVEELSIVGLVRGDTEIVACLAVPLRDKDEPRHELHARAMRSLKKSIAELPKHCQPAVVHLYDVDLPKTATRKVKRSEVKAILERLTAATAAPVTSAATSGGSLAVVQQSLAAITNRSVADIRPEQSLAADLGLDSLQAMELAVALEARLGRPLPQEQLARVETVAELAELCATARPARTMAVIDDEPESKSLDIPAPLAGAAKALLGKAQMGFYGRVMKPAVQGRAFIPHNRNTIVVSNHASHLDMGLVKYALGSYGEDLVSLAAQDYFFDGTLRRTYFEKLTNLQAFDRKANIRQALREAGDTIRSGKTVLLFPEGTRSTDGVVHEFKSTLGHLALSNRTDILPVYLGGTYEALPKGGKVPTRRELTARIGPALTFDELERLTAGMKFATACKVAAKLARAAVVALRDGGVLELHRYASADEALGEKREHPLVTLFRKLEQRYVPGRVTKPVSFYFTLGGENECKWYALLEPERCTIENGKPPGGTADCVLKTTQEIFTRIVEDGYMPSPVEVMSGLVKSNDVSLLGTFKEAFDLP
ncbi:MAG: AMP-binding protein [Deltaproteobacteria bacterium]|nr:AMP-binding protein [Deltaproteobacteria bacterium]